jgi:hypothetical protein
MKQSIPFQLLLLLSVEVNSQNVGIGTVAPTEKLEIVGNLRLTNSEKGVLLNAADRPLISRGWDAFTSGLYSGVGRWGLFMEPNKLIAGLPDLPGKSFEVVTYQENSSIATNLFTVMQNGNAGIGITNPAYKLDVGGRMRVKTGTIGNIFTTSGIWFEDFRDGSNRIFFGMRDSIRVGFYGEGSPGVQWGFAFNARNGDVEVDGALKANTYAYLSPRTFYYTLSGPDFRTINNTDYIFIPYLIGSANLRNSTNPMMAPLHLPTGAIITEMFVSYYDDVIGNDLFVVLLAANGVNVATGIAQATSSGTPGNSLMNDITINHVVDNSFNFYYFNVYATSGTWPNGDGLRINSIRISYTLPGPD